MDEDRIDAGAAAIQSAPAQAPARRSLSVPSSRRFDEPGVALVLGSLTLAIAAGVGLSLGWLPLLLVIVFLQILFSRAWAAYLEVPGETYVAVGILAVGLIADLGIVIARGRVAMDERASEFVQLAPALGLLFFVAVVVQLVRRDGRAGSLAGLIAVTTGGALSVGLAVWLPLEASFSGDAWVAAGIGACAVAGVAIGTAGWVRHVQVPSPALVLPLLLGLVSGPVYVLARIVSG